MIPSPKKASTCATPAPSFRTLYTAGSDHCPYTSVVTRGLLSLVTWTGQWGRAEGGHCVPATRTCRADGPGEAVLRKRGLGLLHEPLPQMSSSLAHSRARSQGKGQGARAFTETLEVAIPLWGPAGGEGLSAGPARLPYPSLCAGLCIAGVYPYCNIHVPALPQPHLFLL